MFQCDSELYQCLFYTTTMAFLLMPSEVARLVYGYFLDGGCEKTAKLFLEESPHLKEFSEGIRNGHRYSTLINQKSLIQFLNAECSSKNDHFHNKSDMMHSELAPEISVNVTEREMMQSCIALLHQIRDDLSKLVDDKILGVKTYLNSAESNHNEPLKTKQTSPNAKFVEGNHCSPRRKCMTPKRIKNHSPIRSSPLETSSHTSESNNDPLDGSSITHSSPLSSATGESSDAVDFIVKPELIYHALLKCKPLQEKLACKINKKITAITNRSSDSNSLQSNCDKSLLPSSNEKQFSIGNIEKDLLPPEVLEEIISSILEEPECSELVELVIEKEFTSFNSPSKLFSSPTASDLNIEKSKTVENEPKNIKNIDTQDILKETKNQGNASNLEKNLVDKFCQNINVNNTVQLNIQTGQFQIGGTNEQTPNKNSNVKANERAKSTLQNPQLPIPRTNSYKFRRLKDKQKEVHEAKKNSQINILNTSRSLLTTTADKTDLVQSSLVASTSKQAANQEVPVRPKMILPKWPNPMGQQFVIQNQRPIPLSNDNIILTTLPSQPILYLNDSFQVVNYPTSLATSSIQASVSLNEKLKSSSFGKDRSSEIILSQPNELSPSKQKQNVESIVKFTSSANQKSSRPLPAILSKSKAKIPRTQPSSVDNISSFGDSAISNKETSNSAIDAKKETQIVDKNEIKNSSTTDRSSTSSIVLENKIRSSKRKSDESAIDSPGSSKRNSTIETDDPKIKTLLNIDMDKFLGNIHSVQQNKLLQQKKFIKKGTVQRPQFDQ